MIVSSMTSQEILLEIIKDSPIVMNKGNYLAESLRRPAIKSKGKYVQKTFDYKSKQKNDWLIIVDYYVKEPFFTAIVCYLDVHGFNGMAVGSDQITFVHYTPHFLSRYNERFLKQENLSKKEILLQFCTKNKLGWLIDVPDINGMTNCFFTRFKNGIGLGYIEQFENMQNTIQHLKTFIANEMIFESQQEEFNYAGEAYETYWNELFKFTGEDAFN